MSVLFDSGSDQLYIHNGTTLTVGTGDFVMSGWVKITTDNNTSNGAMFGIADAVTSGYTTKAIICLPAGASGVGFRALATAGTTADYDDTVNTWRFVVLSRGSGTLRCRVFADSSSTTPVSDLTLASGTDYTTLDSIGIGLFSGELAATYMEVESVKLQTGVTWTDSECRTESQSYSIVKSGGTDRYAWKLTDVDADTNGLYEIGGSGPNLTNSGVTAGSTSPTQLTASTLEQEGFRWVQDDGSESASTFTAAQDTSITAAAGTTKRLRVLVNATGDPATKQYKLQWRLSGGSWADVT